jgi:hypothetical protein
MAKSNTPGDPQNDKDTTAAADPVPGKSIFVNYLAIMVVGLSGVILIILIILGWITFTQDDSEKEKSFIHVKELFSILLPVIGTWVGTILAFYFSKENFEAANQRVMDMVNQIAPADEKLQALKVADVMIKPLDASLLILKDEPAFRASFLNDLVQKMDESHSERLPILEANTLKFIFLLYRTTIERFLLGVSNGSIKLGSSSPAVPGPKGLTVDDMFNSDYKLIKEIIDMNSKQTFLPLTATLDDVKKAMQDNSICQDVFITKTGNKNEAVEGWITNNMIVEKAELFKRSSN